MSSQNIVALVCLVVLAFGTYVAISMFQGTDEPVVDADLSTDDIEIELRRMACFGPCPIYTVHLTGDGTVRFIGQRFTRVEGEVAGSVSREQLFRVGSAIRARNFFGYVEPENCTSFVTDMSSVVLRVKWHGQEREVDRYLGCTKIGADPVPGLSRLIDEIVGVEEWIGTDEERIPVW